MEAYLKAGKKLTGALTFAAVLATLTLIGLWVHAQSKPILETITVYQDPG